VAFALLPDKKTTTYEMLFRELRKLVDLQPGAPARFYMDFEQAPWNVARAEMPWVEVFFKGSLDTRFSA
jgi:hypothetical protein